MLNQSMISPLNTKVRRAAERDTLELERPRALEADPQGVTGTHPYHHRPAPEQVVHLGVDQGAGGRAGAASERLALDTAFVGAQDDLTHAVGLNEIGVRAFGCKPLVVAQGAAERMNLDGFHVIDGHDDVRHAGVEKIRLREDRAVV